MATLLLTHPLTGTVIDSTPVYESLDPEIVAYQNELSRSISGVTYAFAREMFFRLRSPSSSGSSEGRPEISSAKNDKPTGNAVAARMQNFSLPVAQSVIPSARGTPRSSQSDSSAFGVPLRKDPVVSPVDSSQHVPAITVVPVVKVAEPDPIPAPKSVTIADIPGIERDITRELSGILTRAQHNDVLMSASVSVWCDWLLQLRGIQLSQGKFHTLVKAACAFVDLPFPKKIHRFVMPVLPPYEMKGYIPPALIRTQHVIRGKLVLAGMIIPNDHDRSMVGRGNFYWRLEKEADEEYAASAAERVAVQSADDKPYEAVPEAPPIQNPSLSIAAYRARRHVTETSQAFEPDISPVEVPPTHPVEEASSQPTVADVPEAVIQVAEPFLFEMPPVPLASDDARALHNMLLAIKKAGKLDPSRVRAACDMIFQSHAITSVSVEEVCSILLQELPLDTGVEGIQMSSKITQEDSGVRVHVTPTAQDMDPVERESLYGPAEIQTRGVDWHVREALPDERFSRLHARSTFTHTGSAHPEVQLKRDGTFVVGHEQFLQSVGMKQAAPPSAYTFSTPAPATTVESFLSESDCTDDIDDPDADVSDYDDEEYVPEDIDFEALGIDPTAPTNAKPGSEEKVLMMAARYAAGLPLWHERDCYDHGVFGALNKADTRRQ